MRHAGPLRGAKTKWFSREENRSSEAKGVRLQRSPSLAGTCGLDALSLLKMQMGTNWNVAASSTCHGDKIALISVALWPLTGVLSVSTQRPPGNQRKVRLHQRSWQVRSLDMDLAPADPVARAGAAQRAQTIEAEGGKGRHLIPKGTEAPERDTQV